jgi:N-acetyl-gamma-glutamyl-phosphate reductase common form
MTAPWPTIVLGGSGYVAGEFLRLLAQHPQLALAAAVSTSQAGEPIAASFGHLAPVYPEQRFVGVDDALARLAHSPHWALLSAAPHGASAALVDRFLGAAAAAGSRLTVVDASADFRFRAASAFAEIYGHAHPAPHRLAEFTCAVPEHAAEIRTPHAAHPGCFATAMLLGIVPLVRAGAVTGPFFVAATTGSTGAGRAPKETTHHPVRQSNLFAYQVLVHRHAPEVRSLVTQAAGADIELHFVPHSGPFARGIHATIFARPAVGWAQDALRELLAEFYRASPFVQVSAEPPRVKDVAASNFARLQVSSNGDGVVVCAVLDNLVKGAAGGSIQWLNRLLGLPEATGLMVPAAGWI